MLRNSSYIYDTTVFPKGQNTDIMFKSSLSKIRISDFVMLCQCESAVKECDPVTDMHYSAMGEATGSFYDMTQIGVPFFLYLNFTSDPLQQNHGKEGCFVECIIGIPCVI